MILNQSNHNPLKDILEELPKELTPLSNRMFDAIRKHLFSGGVACENDKDVETCLHFMRDLGIISLEKLDKSSYSIKGNM